MDVKYFVTVWTMCGNVSWDAKLWKPCFSPTGTFHGLSLVYKPLVSAAGRRIYWEGKVAVSARHYVNRCVSSCCRGINFRSSSRYEDMKRQHWKEQATWIMWYDSKTADLPYKQSFCNIKCYNEILPVGTTSLSILGKLNAPLRQKVSVCQ